MTSTLPSRGAVFWPVGTGDSTTIVVDDDTVMQIDLHDMAKADSEESPEVAVVDELVQCLPLRDGRPYLAVFALTHADKDHCLGFADLLDKITIGELWATPRLWREYTEDGAEDELCADARAFQEEAERRVDAIKSAIAAGEDPESGDRIIVIGYDTDHHKHAYDELPERYKSGPGKAITALDWEDTSGRFEAFVHAPFAADAAAARNETSLAMQITLQDESGVTGKMLLFGDLAHDTIMKVFSFSESHDREDRVEWDLLLAPHHCSKKVMYLRSVDGDEELEEDVLRAFERHQLPGAVVISSSGEIPDEDSVGANPPHKMAYDRYSEIADEVFVTMEWLDVNDPSPIVFGVTADGVGIVRDETVELAASESLSKREFAVAESRLAAVVAAATLVAKSASLTRATSVTGPDRIRQETAADRGGAKAPQTTVGFGR
jgi:beta-lactamase superfamily II metal-dependent hydrolase